MLKNRRIRSRIVEICIGMNLLVLIACKSRDSGQLARTSSVTDDEAACIFGGDDNRYGSPGADAIDLRVWKIINSTAIASTLAYVDGSGLSDRARSLGFNESKIVKSGSMQAIVMSNSRCIVLALRGTDMNSMRDWFVDLQVSTETVKYGRVHSGFYKAWSSLNRDVVAEVKSQGANNKTFWVTGHSLGGALAGLYAYSEAFERLLFRGPRIDRVVTFGQPLFADAQLSDVMRKEFLGRYFRVVNGLDIVATVPFWLKHFGSLVWFHDDRVEYRPDTQLYGGTGGGISSAVIPPELEPTERSLREFLELTKSVSYHGEVSGFSAMGWPRRIADHFMKGYLDRLQIEIDGLTK